MSAPPSLNITIARQALACLSSNVSGLTELLAEDAVIEAAYGGLNGEAVIINGRDNGVQALRMATGSFSAFRIVDHEIYETTPPGTVIIEATSFGQWKSGKFYNNRYAIVLKLKDGKIVFWREYFNPDLLTPILEILEQV